MNCDKCGVSVFTRPFMRINPTGEDGIFWCDLCVKTHEPELYKNLKEDLAPVYDDLVDILYTQNKLK